MERSEIRDGNGGGYPDNTISPSALTDPDCAEPVIGRRFAPTRWLHPGYSRYCKVLAAALARMRRYRTHHPHRSCGWLRQAKAAESLIAVPAFCFPAAQRVGWVEPTGRANARPIINSAIPINCYWSVDGFRKGLNPSYELLPLARPSSAVEYGWVASHSLCIALRSCGLPAPVFESRHDRNYKDVAHTDRLVRAARFGQERAG